MIWHVNTERGDLFSLDAVDPDLLGGQLQSDAAGELVNGGLGQVVGKNARKLPWMTGKSIVDTSFTRKKMKAFSSPISSR